MGGMNQTRYGAPTAAAAPASHHHHGAKASQGDKSSFATLPEYQYPVKRQTSGGSYSHPNNQNHNNTAAQLPARQHIVPAASPRHQSPPNTAAPAIESPTQSSSGMSDSSNHHYAAQQPCFHYNPYDTQCSRVTCHSDAPLQYQPQFPCAVHHQPEDTSRDHHPVGYDYYHEAEQQQEEEEAPLKSNLPYGTLHGHLEGYVSFVPYPNEEFVNPNKTTSQQGRPLVPSEGNMSRVFLGQLPYQVTDMQLDWLCFTFGNGGAVHFPERITKHDPMRGCKVPTGCIHAYADNELVSQMLNGLHKRVLVDDTGVWYAETPEQQSLLNDYCLMMKNDRTKRYQNRPYDTVVAQFATSSFVRRR